MSGKGIEIAYCAVGGIVLFSGIRGATLSDTAKGVLTGNLSNIPATQGITVNNGSTGSGTNSTTGNATKSTGSAGQYQSYAFSQFSKFGWSNSEQSPLIKLWNKESGWDPNAKNPSSGAAGIPQDITGNMHGGWQGQIDWGLAYIKQRYGTPSMAWAHEVANNWY